MDKFRFILYALVGVCLILVARRLPIPNLEPIIPALVVIGSLSSTKSSKKISGVLILISIPVIDLISFSFRPINLFTWSGFSIIWIITEVKDSNDSMVGNILDTGLGILFFDIFTAFGVWLLWHPMTYSGLVKTYFLQIPFTLYHLASLGFVPIFSLTKNAITKKKEKKLDSSVVGLLYSMFTHSGV